MWKGKTGPNKIPREHGDAVRRSHVLATKCCCSATKADFKHLLHPWAFQPLKMRLLFCLGISGADNPVTCHHIHEEWKPKYDQQDATLHSFLFL